MLFVRRTGLCRPSPFFHKEHYDMTPDILIIQDNAGYHLLHGHLHLAMALSSSGKAVVEVPDHGRVLVAKTREGLVVESEGGHLPLLYN
ncbi:hypothetical protein [Noviherbaspirillum soli]|uniref:hypothetical protein n=1 Tax=Noviherbaspirillum soli TaxID=1064518 RepID=UPI00188D97D1|nr:hypothetical protein [Noviherbaspirillum soli]